MAQDSGEREPPVPGPDWSLPRLVNLTIRRSVLEAPRLEYFRSSYPDRSDVVEFEATFDGPLPGRALPPALFVGDVPVLPQGRAPDANVVRFVSLQPDELEDGATIMIGWAKDPPEDRSATDYRYHLDQAD
jgi:hypothetical protein